MSIIDLLDNPLILGAIVFFLTLVFRKVAWAKDGLPALWLTMGVAAVIATIEWLLQGGPSTIVVCELTLQDPLAFLLCLGRIIQAIAEQAGVIFLACQGVYQLLRREIAGRTILGDRI